MEEESGEKRLKNPVIFFRILRRKYKKKPE